MGAEPCWVELKTVCLQYGFAFWTAKRRISKDNFPVKGYKVGKKWVIDKAVHDEYFRRESERFRNEREAGLLALKSTKS